MFDCQVIFYNQPYQNSHTRQDEDLGSDTPGQPVPCFVLLQDDDLVFFSKPTDQEPIYKISTSHLSAKLDTNSNVLFLTEKDKDQVLLEICSNLATLQKLERHCQGNKNESRYWSPLIYTPCNKTRESYLTVNSILNSKGINNLVVLVAVFSQIRDMISNYNTYGLLDPKELVIPTVGQVLLALVCFLASVGFMYIVEKLALKDVLPNGVANFLRFLNLTFATVQSGVICCYVKINPLLIMGYLVWNILMVPKMISYIHVMVELKKVLPKIFPEKMNNGHVKEEPIEHYVSRENLEVIKKYENDISGLVNLRDIAYFYLAPTLVYQLWYPRALEIKWDRLAKNIVHLTISTLLFLFWMNQYVLPLIESTLKTFHERSFMQLAERLISFCNACVIVYLLIFYMVFHLVTNISAEIIRFGDREFYKEWWDCQGLGHFWVLWNQFVHKWYIRHIYLPLIQKGYSKTFTTLLIFILSGISHEYLWSLSVRSVSSVVTFMFISQIVLVVIEKKYEKFFKGSQLGNMLFWILFAYIIVPYGMFHYYNKYLVTHIWIAS